MTLLLVLLATATVGLSLAFAIGAIKWTLRQVNADDCCNWDDCL